MTFEAPSNDAALIRVWVLEGRSDTEIAGLLNVSVKVVRVVRAAVEAEVRPRAHAPRDLF